MFHNRVCYLLIIIFFLSVGVRSDMYAQSIASPNGRNSIETPIIAMEENIGDTTLTLPVYGGFSVTFNARGWDFDLVDAPDFGEEVVSLATYQEIENGIVYYFYRTTEGEDTLKFTRYVEDEKKQYVFMVDIVWGEEKKTYENGILYSNPHVIIERIPQSQSSSDTTENSGEEKQEESSVQVQTQEKIELQEDSLSKDKNGMMNKESQSRMQNDSNQQIEEESEMQSNTRTDNIAPQASLNVIEKNNSSELIDEEFKDMGMGTSQVEEENVSEMEDMQEEEIIPYEDMSYEEIISYIGSHWNTISYQEMMDNINLWIAEYPNMFERSSALWRYLMYISDNIEKPEDIDIAIELCQLIIKEYPLGYEYYKAKELLIKLNDYYVYFY